MKSCQKSTLRVALDAIVWVSVLVLYPSASAQHFLSFEVATIKPAAPDRSPTITKLMDSLVDELRFGEGAGSRANSGSFMVNGATLRMLIAHAYGISRSRVFGPDWIDSIRYDIVAKIPGKPGLEGFRKMQQQLLAERFGLVLRREPRKMAAYRMTVAKSGHKLKPPILPSGLEGATEEEKRLALRSAAAKIPPTAANNQMGVGNETLDAIASRLEVHTDLPVKNATGLAGAFSFSVGWSGKDGFRDAVEDQLGLVLTRSNEDLDVLEIEKAEKSPTEN